MSRKISQLNSTTSVGDTDTFPLVQGGETKKIDGASMRTALGGGTVADDIAKHAGTDIDWVRGLNRLRFYGLDNAFLAAGVALPIGGVLGVYSEDGGVAGMRGKKPVPPGHYDIEDFGGRGDYFHGRTVTASSASPNITLSSTTGLRVGQMLRLNHAVTREIQSITDATHAVLTANAGTTCTDGACYTDNASAFTALKATTEILAPAGCGIGMHFAGAFYTSETWHVRERTMRFSGVGHTDENKKPGSMLVVDSNYDAIFEHSATFGDDPTSNAGYSAYYDFTIWCRGNATGTSGHGMVVRGPVFAQNMLVTGFGGNGIEIDADTSEGTGNASACRFFGVRCGTNRGHGMHLRGGDTGSISVVGCSFPANGGWGVWDESGLGNFFAGIHCEGNVGNPLCRVTTTMGSADVDVDNAQLLWHDVAYTSLDGGVENARTGARITIPGVTGTKEVLDIQYETRTGTVTDATNTSPIVVEVVGHPYHNGDTVYVTGVTGNTAVNGRQRRITVIDADHFSLEGTTGNGAYAGGGTVKDVFPSAVVTLDSTCDAAVLEALALNADGRNHDYAATGPLTTSTFIGCYSEASLNKIDHPAQVLGGLLAQTQHVGTGHINASGTIRGRPISYLNSRGTVRVSSSLGVDDTNQAVLHFEVPDLGGGDYYDLRYLDGVGWWSLQRDGSSGQRMIQLPTNIVATPRQYAPAFANGLFLGDPGSGVMNYLGKSAAQPTTGTFEVGDYFLNEVPADGEDLGWVCMLAGVDAAAIWQTMGTVGAVEPVLVDPDIAAMTLSLFLKKGDFRAGATNATWFPTASAGASGARKMFSANVLDQTPYRQVGGARYDGSKPDYIDNAGLTCADLFSAGAGTLIVIGKAAGTLVADSANGYDVPSHFGDAGNGDFALTHTTSGIRAFINDGSPKLTSYIAKAAGVPYFACMQWDGATLSLDVDNSGSPVTVACGNLSAGTLAARPRLGKNYSGAGYTGEQALVICAQTKLSSGNVTKIYDWAVDQGLL